MSGWIVSTTILGLEAPEMRLFAVGESDPADAVEAVERKIPASDDTMVRIISPLSPRSEATLGLLPGEVMEMTS
jgi:hypothetical protein